MSTKQPSVCCSQKTNLDRANEGGWTPLMYASYIGHETVVQQLLEAGVSVNSTNNEGQSPLALATSCGNDKTAELLIKVSGSHTRMRGLARTHTHTHTQVVYRGGRARLRYLSGAPEFRVMPLGDLGPPESTSQMAL